MQIKNEGQYKTPTKRRNNSKQKNKHAHHKITRKTYIQRHIKQKVHRKPTNNKNQIKITNSIKHQQT